MEENKVEEIIYREIKPTDPLCSCLHDNHSVKEILERTCSFCKGVLPELNSDWDCTPMGC